MAAATLSAQRPAIARYTLTDLGTLGGDSSEATGLNLLGDVVGSSKTAAGLSHAFLVRNGQMIDLGTLTGGSESFATAVSDEGIVVGYGGINHYGTGFREFTQGFVWQDGTLRELGALYCPCSFNVRHGTSRALAVNRGGRVVGDSRVLRMGLTHALLWQPGTLHDLGDDLNAIADSAAYAVNDREEIAGGLNGRAFLLHGGVVDDLGALPGHATSAARALNDIGQVAGDSFAADGTPRAFLWDRGSMRELPRLAGDSIAEARSLNISGQAVGRSGSPDWVRSHAVLWQDGAAIDLNSLVVTPGWTLLNAMAINDVGQIAGAAMFGGQVRAYLLTPVGQRFVR